MKLPYTVILVMSNALYPISLFYDPFIGKDCDIRRIIKWPVSHIYFGFIDSTHLLGLPAKWSFNLSII